MGLRISGSSLTGKSVISAAQLGLVAHEAVIGFLDTASTFISAPNGRLAQLRVVVIYSDSYRMFVDSNRISELLERAGGTRFLIRRRDGRQAELRNS